MPFFKDPKPEAPKAPETTPEAPKPTRKPGGFFGTATPAQEAQKAVAKTNHRVPTDVAREQSEALRESRPGRRSAQFAPESFVSDETVGRASHFGKSFLKRLVFDSGPTAIRGASRTLDRLNSSVMAPMGLDMIMRPIVEKIAGENRVARDAEIDAMLEDWQKKGSEYIKLNPQYAGEFWADVIPTGGADLLAMMAAGYVGGPAAAAFTGAGMGAEMQYEDAVRHGATEEEKSLALFGGGALGLTDVLPWGKVGGMFLKKSPKLHASYLDVAAKMVAKVKGSSKFARGFAEALEVGTEESVQEFFQTIGENATAKALYDEHRELFDGAAEAGAAGGVLGVFFGGVRRAARTANLADRARQKQAIKADTDAEVKQREQTKAPKVGEREARAGRLIDESPLDLERREQLREARAKNLMDRASRARHKTVMDELSTELDRIREKYPEGDEKDALIERKTQQLEEAQQEWAATFASRMTDSHPLPPEVRTAMPAAEQSTSAEVFEAMQWAQDIQIDSPTGWRSLWKRVTSMPAADLKRAAEIANKVTGSNLDPEAKKDEVALFVIDAYKSVTRGLRRQGLDPERASRMIEDRADELAEMGTIANVLSGPQLKALGKSLPEASDDLSTIVALREHGTGEARKDTEQLKALAIAVGRPDLAAKIDGLNIDETQTDRPEELGPDENAPEVAPDDVDVPLDEADLEGAIPEDELPRADEIEESPEDVEQPPLEAKAPEPANPEDFGPRLITEKRPGDELWDFGNLEAAKKNNAATNGREILVQMDVEQFTNLATDALENESPEEFQKKVDQLVDLAQKGIGWLDIPRLDLQTKGNVSRVIGHEGRHRAAAALQLGYSTIPVVLADGDIRWDKTLSPSNRDHLPLPKVLRTQRKTDWWTTHPVTEQNIEALLRERGVEPEGPMPEPSEAEGAPAPVSEAQVDPAPVSEAQEATPEQAGEPQENLPSRFLPISPATLGRLTELIKKGGALDHNDKDLAEQILGNMDYKGQPVMAFLLNEGIDGFRVSEGHQTGKPVTGVYLVDMLDDVPDLSLDLDADKIDELTSDIFSDFDENSVPFQKARELTSYMRKLSERKRDTAVWRTAKRLDKYVYNGSDPIRELMDEDTGTYLSKQLAKLPAGQRALVKYNMTTLAQEGFQKTEAAVKAGKLGRWPKDQRKKRQEVLWYPIEQRKDGSIAYTTNKPLAKKVSKGLTTEETVGVEINPKHVIARSGHTLNEALTGKSKKYKDEFLAPASYWVSTDPTNPLTKSRVLNGDVSFDDAATETDEGTTVDDVMAMLNAVKRTEPIKRTPEEEANHKVWNDPEYGKVDELFEAATENPEEAFEYRQQAQKLLHKIRLRTAAGDTSALSLHRGTAEQQLSTARARKDRALEGDSDQDYMEASSDVEIYEQMVEDYRAAEREADKFADPTLDEDAQPSEPVDSPQLKRPVFDDTDTPKKAVQEEKEDPAKAERAAKRKHLLRAARLTSTAKASKDYTRSIKVMQGKVVRLKAQLAKAYETREAYRTGKAAAGKGESIVAEIRNDLKANKNTKQKQRHISMEALLREYKTKENIPGVWKSLARNDGTVTLERLYEDFYSLRDEYGFEEDWSYGDFLDMVTDQDQTKRIFPSRYSDSRVAKNQERIKELVDEIDAYEFALEEALAEDEQTAIQNLRDEAKEAERALAELDVEEELAQLEEGLATSEDAPAPEDADAPDAGAEPRTRGGKLDIKEILKRSPAEAATELSEIEAEILEAGRELSQKYAKTGVDVLDVQKQLAATPRGQMEAADRKLADQNAQANARRLARQMVAKYTDSATMQGSDNAQKLAGPILRKVSNKLKKRLALQNFDKAHSNIRGILRHLTFGKLLGPEWHRQKSSAENKSIWEGLINGEVQTHLDAAVDLMKERNLAPTLLTEALMGDTEAMAALPPPVQRRAVIVQDRVQTLADAIFDELENIQDVNTAEDIRMWAAGRMAALATNTHRYITRAYRADVDNDYRQWMWSDDPNAAALREEAIDALVEKIEADPTVAEQGKEGNREIAFGILKGIAHDMAQPSWTEQVEAKGPVSVRNLRRRGTLDPRVAKFLGQIDDPKLAVAKTLTAQNNLLGNLRWMRQLADYEGPNGERFATELPNPDAGMVVQLPDTPAYGALAGMWVEPAVQEGFNDHFQDAQAAQRHWIERMMGFKQNPAIRAFKEVKTVGNPGTHFRNLIGNVQFSDFANNNPFNPANAWSYSQATRLLIQFHGQARGGDLSPELREVIESGVLGSQFFKDPRLEQAMRELQADMSQGVDIANASLKGIERAAKLRDRATRAYLAEDQIYRVASYLKQRKLGKDQSEAARWTNMFFPDYDQNPSMVHYGVNSGIANPFIAFTTSLPRIYGNAMMNNPVKFLSQIVQTNAILGTSFLLSGALVGKEEDEDSRNAQQKKMRRLLPDWAKKSVVFKSPDGKVKAINLQNVIPWADVQDMIMDDRGAPRGLAGIVSEVSERAFGGNPLWEAIISTSGGNSSSESMAPRYRTGPLGPASVLFGEMRRLPESPTLAERAQVFMTHAVDWVTPGAITQVDRVVQSLDKNRFDKYNRPLNTTDALLGFFGGSISEPAWDVNHYFETWEQVRALESRTKIAQSLVDNPNTPWEQLDEQYSSVTKALEDYRTNMKEIDEALEAAKRMGGTMTLQGDLKRKARGLLGQRKSKERDAQVMLRILRQRMK